jgi:hypothetical protein
MLAKDSVSEEDAQTLLEQILKLVRKRSLDLEETVDNVVEMNAQFQIRVSKLKRQMER